MAAKGKRGPEGQARLSTAGWIEEHGQKYRACWRDGGVVRRQPCATWEEADEYLLGVQRARRNGRYVAPSTMTVGELVTEYLDRARGRLSPNTIGVYRGFFRRTIAPGIGAMKVATLDTITIQRWFDRAEMTPATQQMVYQVLSGAMKEAVGLRIIPDNVMRGVRLAKGKRAVRDAWSVAEMRLILAAVRADPTWYGYYVLAFHTGMRPGELTSLRWADIDRAGKRAHVRSTLTRDEQQRGVLGSETKTHHEWTVALDAQVLAVLDQVRADQERRRAQHPAWQDTGLVLDRGDGGFIGQSTRQARHEAVIDRAGVRYLPPHCTRHTFVTIARANGIPIEVVSASLGHRSTQIAADVYHHVTREMQASAAAIMGSVLYDNIDGETTENEGVTPRNAPNRGHISLESR